jgi:two-component system chemotaxis response regulator CheY
MPCSAPILVVDDDPEIRDAICMVLGAEGYPTNSAGDGEEAIERLHDDRPCLILLDLMMPRMNGWQFCERERTDPGFAKIPVVIMTAFGEKFPDAVETCGAVALLKKPFSIDAILDVVGRHCKKKSA